MWTVNYYNGMQMTWPEFLDYTWDRGWDACLFEDKDDPCGAARKVRFFMPYPMNTDAINAEIRAWSDGYHACTEHIYGSRQWSGRYL
jgi:hypothetical protein